MKRFIIYTLLFVSYFQLNAQGSLRFYSEGRIFFSGDPVQTFIIPGDGNQVPVTGDERVNVVLVNSAGMVRMHETYLITELGKSAVFPLSEELPTDNYRLIASWDGVQSVIPIHVYQPSVLSSVVQDEKLDTSLGIAEEVYPESTISFPAETEGTLPLEKFATPGRAISIAKIVRQSSLNAPGIGKTQSKSFEIPEVAVSVKPISQHPDSRVSMYFIDQGVVEEHYVNELKWLNLRMGRHYGTSRIYAFQFGERGNRLGSIPVEVSVPNMPVFPSAEGKVPYDKDIQKFLNERKNRKFINQVYGQVELELAHFSPEEWPDPEISIRASNYINLASLEEIINNVVPKSQVIRKNKQFEIRLSPSNSGYRYPASPLVLLNGVPVENIDSLLEIPSEDVAEVSVYNSLESLRRFGTLGIFGVMSITLEPEASEKYEAKELPVFRGINDLEAQEVSMDTNLDIRDLLGWQLTMDTADQKITWMNSDVTGSYVIYLYRISPEGKESSEQITFEVTAPLR